MAVNSPMSPTTRAAADAALNEMMKDAAEVQSKLEQLDRMHTELRRKLANTQAEVDRLNERRIELEQLVKFVRQTVHQTHHRGPIEACVIASCREANKVLPLGS